MIFKDDGVTLLALADYLAHQQKLNEHIAHVPEMSAYLTDLRKWEALVRRLANHD